MSSLFESFRTAIHGNNFNTAASVQRIKPQQVKEWLEQENPPLLIDVRTVDEHNQGHIPGSNLLPVHDIPNNLAELPSDKSQAIVVYCASGARSAQAARFLVKNGYENVYDMGGIFSWPFKIVK